MDAKSSPRKDLELVPIEEPAPAPEALPQPDVAAVATPADKFIAKAMRELDAGKVHDPLWQRVLATAGDDKKSARTAYVRARATELRLRDAKRSQPSRPHVPVDAGAGPAEDASEPRRARKVAKLPPRLLVALGAAAIALAAALVAWVAMRGDGTDAPAQAQATAAAHKQPVGAPAQFASAGPDDAVQVLAAKVTELRAAGNWNVHVLHASEWTRKEPFNPVAWHELAVGYANLHQLAEASEAAIKAVQLAPHDAALWRHVGDVRTAQEDTDAALKAFEQASSLDERDVYSLVQLGTLHAQVQHFSQARIAFDNALAASPTNVDALCGQRDVARKQARTKDVEALAKQLAALGAACPDSGESAATATASVKIPQASGRAPSRAR